MTSPSNPGVPGRGIITALVLVSAGVAVALWLLVGREPPPPASTPPTAAPLRTAAKGTLPPLVPEPATTPPPSIGSVAPLRLAALEGPAETALAIPADRALARVNGQDIKLADLVPEPGTGPVSMTRGEYAQRLRRVIRERVTFDAARQVGLDPEREKGAQSDRLRGMAEARRKRMAAAGAEWSSETDAARLQEAAHLASLTLQQTMVKARGAGPAVPSGEDLLAHFNAHRDRYPEAPAGAEKGGREFAAVAERVRKDVEKAYADALRAMLDELENKADIEAHPVSPAPTP